MADDKSPKKDGEIPAGSRGNGAGEDPSDPKSLWEILNQPDSATRDRPAREKPAGSADKDADTQEEEYTPRELHPEDYIPQDSSGPVSASTDASHIQRILTNPDAMDDELARPVSVKDEGDFDHAVRNFIQNDTLSVNCRKHPERQAVDFCPQCEAYYCQQCMVVRRGRLICSDCAETLYTPSEEEILQAQEMGLNAPAAEVTPEEAPEFELSGRMFGMEGRPASPLKRLIALLIDLAITRLGYVALFALLGFVFGNIESPAFHLTDKVEGVSTSMRVVNALFLFRPPLPWLVIVALLDFVYFFLYLAFSNRTPGMGWAGCRIITEWGDFVPFGAVALRTLVFMVFLGIPAVILAFFFPAFRGPHDYVAGTVVINYSGVKRIDAYENIQIKL